MSDKTIDAVKAYLHGQNKPNPNQSIDSIHQHEMTKGKRAKRILDKQRTNQNYYITKTIQDPLLKHYENVDWWERDTTHDFASYGQKK